MELIILSEAWNELRLRAGLGRPVQGYLLGKQTGPGLFVKKIFCLSWSEILKPEIFFQVEKNQRLDILGVFSLKASSASQKKLLKALFTGKVLLTLTMGSRGQLIPRARKIDFNRKFYFRSVGRIILDVEAADA